MLTYVNGEFLPENRATVSVLDGGFQYGFGLFETVRAYRGKPFRLTQHLDRLGRSAGILGIPFSDPGIEEAACHLVQANTGGEAYLRVILTNGPLSHFLEQNRGFSLVIRGMELGEQNLSLSKNGISSFLADVCQDETSPLVSSKSLCFLPRLLVKKEAREKGFEDGLLLNRKGQLTEASSSNLFFVKDRAVYTPSLDCGLLPGITRSVILELCRKLGLSLTEGVFVPRDLKDAHEAFLTNSVSEILPLVSFDGCPIGQGKPGKITKALATAFKEQVLMES